MDALINQISKEIVKNENINLEKDLKELIQSTSHTHLNIMNENKEDSNKNISDISNKFQLTIDSIRLLVETKDKESTDSIDNMNNLFKLSIEDLTQNLHIKNEKLETITQQLKQIQGKKNKKIINFKS